MGRDDYQVPEANLEIYRLLYCIEVAVRELIIEEMQQYFGERWWKQRLPGDVKEKYGNSREVEATASWTELVPHHPLYYVDFPDLRKIMERTDNWDQVFQRIFSRKDILDATLSELEPIRNKIAHNRKATPGDVEVVKGAFAKLVVQVGESRFGDLLLRMTIAESVPELLERLAEEAEQACVACKECQRIGELPTWHAVKSKWWFDEEFLGNSIETVVALFELFAAYKQLPRSRGQGHKIEQWVKTRDVDATYQAALKELGTLRLERGGSQNARPIR